MAPVTPRRRAFPIVEHAGLANAITATSVLLGVSGVFLAARGAAVLAVACGALALPCDVLDGLVARRTGTSSAFGAQLDTLADATSFCLLPAATALALGVPAWVLVPAAFYAVTGVLRLARFAVVGTSNADGRERFEGLPTAVAAGYFQAVAAAGAWADAPARAGLLSIAYVALGLLMVSSLPFPKRGLAARSLWGIVPLSVLALWIRLG
jgi:CDP-diacylglycerol--serine O-phosphatidyltransferase